MSHKRIYPNPYTPDCKECGCKLDFIAPIAVGTQEFCGDESVKVEELFQCPVCKKIVVE